MGKFLIYALHHDESAHVYIGKSSTGIQRPRSHGNSAYMTKHAHLPVICWIAKRKKQGKTYSIAVLEECHSASELDEAERFYIAYMRSIKIPLLNLTDGGEGVCGRVMSPSSKAKLAKSLIAFTKTEKGRAQIKRQADVRRGSTVPVETKVKTAAAMRKWAATPVGRAHMAAMTKKGTSPEARAKAGITNKVSQIGRKHSDATIEKIRAIRKGTTISAETRFKMSQALIGRPRSLETREKISRAHRGRKKSAEHIANISAARRGYKQSAETIAKRVAACRGKKRTAEQKARISAGLRNRRKV